MKKLIACAAVLAACGCATKSRMVEVKGLYMNANTGCVAIGKGEVVAVPEGTDSAAIKYSEDTAWLAPSVKTHEVKIMLTGTNSVSQADGIIKSLCEAFIKTAPSIAATDNTGAPTVLGTLESAAKQKTLQKAIKAASLSSATNIVSAASSSVTDAASLACPDGSCTIGGSCPDGSCSE